MVDNDLFDEVKEVTEDAVEEVQRWREIALQHFNDLDKNELANLTPEQQWVMAFLTGAQTFKEELNDESFEAALGDMTDDVVVLDVQLIDEV